MLICFNVVSKPCSRDDAVEADVGADAAVADVAPAVAVADTDEVVAELDGWL